MIPLWPIILLFCSSVYFYFNPPGEKSNDIPTIRYSHFLPDFVNRLIFIVAAPQLIKRGYDKCKNGPYRIIKADGDLVILPAKYLAEIRHIPPSRLSGVDAQFENILGKYTNVLVESHLPTKTVIKRLTPGIGRVLPRILNELQYAFHVEVPDCDDKWVSVNLYDMILNILTRATSRVIVGETVCRNPKWLQTVTNYTVNLGITVMLLRPFPEFLRPMIAKVLPSVKKLRTQLRYVQKELFIPMILSRRYSEKNEPAYEKPDDFLQWMMDLAEDDFDKDPANLSQNLLIVMSLAVVHTSTMLMTHTLFDLIIRPEYAQSLREEIAATLPDGWDNATQAAFASQRRLDSFMRESQRFNPTGELSTHRMVKEDMVLSDGLVLKKGTHICFPSKPMGMDSSIVKDALTFDGFRWCDDPENKNASLVSIGPSNMHFGYGRQACPGRFFATNTNKAILSRLIADYEFKFEDGRKTRPNNILLGEQIMPNMYTKVLMRKREFV
ncbi:cytochrome P450 [Aspergillus clavatus NRRL 1]|uniref:Cytochrome P450 monooxygenase, putative n=1 Tax=Aspergillus clavatus (strain ATCC 1007 / CBS 513.65 / DSM 816 / NCTC 3887 / NRRL 1 / QM 1276 / 107) TaxID=344612 RepID=A1C526_ASPCL|nr:cytochrome P450 monooxygenase, putative [Aspergillus clavatus NRRL 1]EAW14794.1 cytochrome P450 monooxygenase, putative [Aspergillus clavatus NRRL 1]